MSNYKVGDKVIHRAFGEITLLEDQESGWWSGETVSCEKDCYVHEENFLSHAPQFNVGDEVLFFQEKAYVSGIAFKESEVWYYIHLEDGRTYCTPENSLNAVVAPPTDHQRELLAYSITVDNLEKQIEELHKILLERSQTILVAWLKLATN